MLKRSNKIAVWLMLALFVGVLAWIVSLRLGSGDIYPEYSSLRADPLGAKAFYESVGRLPGRNVSRHLHPLERLRGGNDVTVLVLGAGSSAGVDGGIYEQLERIARTGARVVLAMNATDSHTALREEERINTPELPIKEEDETGEKKEDKPVAREFRGPYLALIDPLRREQDEIIAELVAENGPTGLPATLRWYGRYCFDKISDDSQVIYEADGKPVVVEQKVGLGTIVLCADSFPFSNEALARERSAEFLLWAAGSAKNITFDESHLGVRHGNSIMLLLRDFRLQGLFFGFLVLAGLWVWRASASFVPAYVEQGAAEIVQGKTAREGVVHLLERNLSPDELPQICLTEWRKSHPNLNSFDAARYAEAERILNQYLQLPRKERNPIHTYGEITKALSK
jgi:hypothetical protein